MPDYFNPRTPRGVRRRRRRHLHHRKVYFNPRTPRGVRPAGSQINTKVRKISIHAPREGCDHRRYPGLHGEPTFQSTHPARGATITSPYFPVDGAISIHAPREGCDRAGTETHQSGQPISIHAPREGCDAAQPFRPQGRPQFQSTHPARGATPKSGDSISSTRISIHAPREGCDFNSWTASVYKWHFNPRTPRGVRPTQYGGMNGEKQFQSTHPARGATQNYHVVHRGQSFQSTHPARGATLVSVVNAPHLLISIHAPREGCDSKLY